MDYGTLLRGKPKKEDPPGEEELREKAERIRQEHIQYLQSDAWAEKSGGYDPAPLIEDLGKAEFIFNPDEFARRPDDPESMLKATRVVRTPDGRVVVNVNPNQLSKGERVNVEDLLYHELGHVAYPNFGPATPEIVNQRTAMLENQKGYQALMADDTKAGEYFRENLAPIYKALAQGDMSPDEYRIRAKELAQQRIQGMSKGDLRDRTIMKVINRALNVNRVVPAHEIRQKLIEQRMGGSKRLEEEGTYDPDTLQRLLREVAQQSNNSTGYSSLFT